METYDGARSAALGNGPAPTLAADASVLCFLRGEVDVPRINLTEHCALPGDLWVANDYVDDACALHGLHVFDLRLARHHRLEMQLEVRCAPRVGVPFVLTIESKALDADAYGALPLSVGRVLRDVGAEDATARAYRQHGRDQRQARAVLPPHGHGRAVRL